MPVRCWFDKRERHYERSVPAQVRECDDVALCPEVFGKRRWFGTAYQFWAVEQDALERSFKRRGGGGRSLPTISRERGVGQQLVEERAESCVIPPSVNHVNERRWDSVDTDGQPHAGGV